MADIKEERKHPPQQGGRAARMMPGEKARDFKGTILTLFGYLRPYKWQLVLVGLMSLLSTVFAIVSPTVLGMATDIVVKGVMGTGVDYHALLMIILVLLGLYLLSWLFGAVQAWVMAVVSQKIIYTLRERMSEKLDRLPLKYFDRVSYGDVQSRMVNDIETINQTLTASITQIIHSLHPEGKTNWLKTSTRTVIINKDRRKPVYFANFLPNMQLKSPKPINAIMKITL